MANANISAPRGVQVGNFNLPLSFMEAVSGFSRSNLNVVAVDGNGSTGVVFAVSGRGANYNIAVTLPDAKTGRFKLSLHGTVTPIGSGISEAATSNEVTIQYDTASVVVANFGTVDYRDAGEIVLPVVFGEDITYLHKTDFTLEKVEGDEVWEVIEDYWLVERDGVARTFFLHFQMRPNKQGKFKVSLTGYVYKTVTTIRDDVRISPITVSYNTTTPEIVDFDIPETYTFGENFDMRVAFNTIVSGWHANNSFTEIWIEEGAQLGMPTPYKWTGAQPETPDALRAFLQQALPDDLTGTDWKKLEPPAGGHEGQWHGEEGQIFLMRIEVTNADATGIAQFTLRPNSSLRGPVA